MIVLAVRTDNMVNCMYIDSNGVLNSEWFYPEEIYCKTINDQQAGFK